jgi:HD-GYP domain-containing protein (c-di-GMP phosphodiesterase class II)
MSDERERFARLLDVGREITQVRDVDVLLEKILAVARELVGADAGSIYIKEGEALRFSHTQNEALRARLPRGRKLIYSTFSVPIDDTSLAGHVARTGEALNIPDAYALPAGAPYSFDRDFDEMSGYRTRSILTLPLPARGGVLGVLQLINAKDGAGNAVPFRREDESLAAHLAGSAAMCIERAQMTRALILRMIGMAELRDPQETGSHANRVAAYAVEIYEAWARMRDMPAAVVERDRDTLRMAAMLHDVGKVAVADGILKKPGRLDAEEVRAMQRHTWLGARLFESRYSELDDAARAVALNHHERWDGAGYPGHVDPASGAPVPGSSGSDGSARGKRGEEIPPFGRVVAIADVYDALGRKRIYKDAWGEDRILETIREGSGRQFDPEVVEAFFSCLDSVRSIAERYPA